METRAVSRSKRPAVESRLLPAALLRVVNPVLRALLRSPAHRAVSRQVMLLHVTGRKSGRVYVIPVGRHYHDGQLVASAGGAWRRNVAGGADLEVTLDGHQYRAHGELLDDPQVVAEIFGDLLVNVGLSHAIRLGLKLNVDRAPTTDELRAALVDRNVLRLSILDTARPASR